jgi:hypothetical protein
MSAAYDFKFGERDSGTASIGKGGFNGLQVSCEAIVKSERPVSFNEESSKF